MINKHYILKKDVTLSNGKTYIEGKILFLYWASKFECYLRDENTGNLAMILSPSQFNEICERVQVDPECYFIKNLDYILDDFRLLTNLTKQEKTIIEDMHMGRPKTAFYDIKNHLNKNSVFFNILEKYDIKILS